MKKYSLRLYMAILIAFCSLSYVHASSTPSRHKAEVAKVTPPPPEVQKLIDRVYEIRHMDFSTLTKAEKKELKNELRATKKQLKVVEAVYIPVSTAIIILLILLLVL